MRKLIARFLARLAAALNNVEAKVEPVLESVEQTIANFTTNEETTMSKTITDTGIVTLLLAVATAKGNPAAEPVTLTSSDPTIATAVMSAGADANSVNVTITAVGKLGDATITATTGTLTATYDITVVAGPAASLTLTEVLAAA